VEDIIAVDYGDGKASIPTPADESSTDDDDDLDTPIKTAVSKLKRRAPRSSTPPTAKRVKIETAASQLSQSNHQIAYQLSLANDQRIREWNERKPAWQRAFAIIRQFYKQNWVDCDGSIHFLPAVLNRPLIKQVGSFITQADLLLVMSARPQRDRLVKSVFRQVENESRLEIDEDELPDPFV